MQAVTDRERFVAGSLFDSSEPDDVICPATVDECVEVIKAAAAHRQAVIPWGGGTSIAAGHAPVCRRWVLLATEKIASGLTVSPADSLVTCPAGLRWAALRGALEREGQFVTVDPPHEDQATVGGVVAAGSFGLLRSSCGGPRDSLVAVRFVLASGEVIQSGATVVKNAAGYDLCRLLSGSWGTLGLITQVTFRTSPLPAARADLRFASESSTAVCAAAQRICGSDIGPRYVLVRLGDCASLLVGLAGSRKLVAWQTDRVASEAAASSLREDASSNIECYRNHLAPMAACGSVRVWLPRSETSDITLRLAAHADTVVALPAVGVVSASVTGPSEPDVTRTRINALEAILAGRRRTWLRLPADLRSEIGPWPTPPSVERMRALKRALDPGGVFSPGRFVGGI